MHHYTTEDEKTSDSFERLWTNFVKTKNPNGDGYVDADCTYVGELTDLAAHGYCAPADVCEYHYKLGDLTPSQSCRVKGDYIVWPAYEEETDQDIVLTQPLAVDHHLNGEICDFWDDYLGL